MALCSLQVFDKGVKVHFLAYSGTIHRSHLTQHSMKLEHDQEVRVLLKELPYVPNTGVVV